MNNFDSPVPILRLGELLLASFQTELGDEQAQTFQSVLLRLVRSSDVKGIIIDVTGLDIVDSYMAKILNDTAEMVRLLGPQVVVCGIRPMVAMTLVEMGREFIGVQTTLNLDRAIASLRYELRPIS